MRRSLALPIVALALVAQQPAFGQQVQRIAAIVNDDVISIYDLQSRIHMVITLSRLTDGTKVRRRLAPQVLKTLIDERLQLQEAKRRNVSVSRRDIKRAVAAIENSNKLPTGKFEEFLIGQGIQKQTVMDQIRAKIAWSKLVQRQLGSRISIGDDEIDEILAKLKSSQGQVGLRLAEIFLSVDSPNDEAAVRQTAARLIEQIRAGARFDVLARQFSQSATAAVGGDLGWLPKSELDEQLVGLVSNLNRGAVAGPIRTISGYRIVMLRNQRRIASADPRQVKLGLKQIFLPLSANANRQEAESQIDLAKTLSDSLSGCDDVGALAREVGSPRPPDLGTFALSELTPDIRTAVQDLKVGNVSRPVRTPEGLLVLMVCQRSEPEVRLPNREQIGKQLMEKQFDLLSRRYMRDIRSAAVVDIRV